MAQFWRQTAVNRRNRRQWARAVEELAAQKREAIVAQERAAIFVEPKARVADLLDQKVENGFDGGAAPADVVKFSAVEVTNGDSAPARLNSSNDRRTGGGRRTL
jgi:hypothetical protein